MLDFSFAVDAGGRSCAELLFTFFLCWPFPCGSKMEFFTAETEFPVGILADSTNELSAYFGLNFALFDEWVVGVA